MTEEIVKNWHILFRQDLYCCAGSDSGIDFRGEYMRNAMSIPPETIVFEGDEPVGVSFADHLFVFGDPETHTLTVEKAKRYVGGWGDVTETDYYTLTPGAPPDGSFHLCLQ